MRLVFVGVIMIINLSNRLQAIADFIPEGACVADIGTDHGYLPIYLAQTSRAGCIIASDISAGSLNAARRSVKKYDLTGKIELICAPGLDGIDEGAVDTIVIAGVGGETIVGILQGAPWVNSGKTLILQPQTKLGVLLNYIAENKLKIMGAKVTKDKRKDYIIIVCKGGQLSPQG